jgi:N-glycosylase/DNA lyase
MLSLGQINNAVAETCRFVARRYGGRVTTIYVDERNCFRSLTGCILGSQVTYEMALAYADHLTQIGLLDELIRASQPARLAPEVESILNRPLRIRFGSSVRTVRYRFPASKARALSSAAHQIYRRHGSISEKLETLDTADQVRMWLVSCVPGIGPKQASLFLRTIGYCDSMAILDSHVIRYLRLWSPTIPTYVQTIEAYARLESVFRSIAKYFGYSVAIVDLAVWGTMRAISKGGGDESCEPRLGWA